MSELWRQFIEELLRQGYSTSDLSFCTEDVFRNLLRQSGFTSPKAVDQLVREWHHHLENLRTDSKIYASPTKKSTDKLHLPELTQYNIHDIALMGMQLLRQHVSQMLEQKITVREAQVETVTTWTSPYANKVLTNFANEVANMPNSEIRLLWKLCSPVTIAKVQQILSIDNSSDADNLCSNGVVLYDASKPITRLNTLIGSKSSDSNSILSHLAQLAESGWGLVAFDVAPGHSRVIHSAEVRELGNSLHRFTMSECHQMLKEAHFDSFAIPAMGATIICNAHQLLPRYIVYFSVEYAVNELSNISSNKMTQNNTFVSSTMPSTQTQLTAPYELQADMRKTHVKHDLLYEAVSDTREQEEKRQQEQQEREQHDKGRELEVENEQPERRFAKNYSVRASPTSINVLNTENSINKNIVSNLNQVNDIKSFDAFSESSSVMCTIHSQKHVEFWSPSEHKLLCSLCLYFDGYSRANCVPIDQAVREQVPKLQRWLQNAQTFQHEVSGVFELFQAATDDIVRNEEEIVNDISEQFRSIHTQLKELEKKLCNECHLHSLRQQQQMQLASDEVSATVEEVNELVHFIDGPLTMYKQKLYSSKRNQDRVDSDADAQNTQITVYAKLLQGAQSAFKKWAQVELPSYILIERKSNLLADVYDVLRNINIAAVPSTCKGNVELPGAIDVNSLCDSL